MTTTTAAAEAIAFADIDSAADPRFAAGTRVDPYWESLWTPGSQAVWSTTFAVNGIPAARFDPGPGLIDALLHPKAQRGPRLAALGVLDSWRTVTAQQLCAFTGSDQFASDTKPVVQALFHGGVIDIGDFPQRYRDSPTPIYRPSPTTVFDKRISPKLTYPEWLAVTGGTDWSAGHQYDRHNVLAAELALRAAEYTSMTPLGEKFATVDLLAYTGLGKTIDRPDNRTGDGVLVRDDGLRVVFEITANASATIEAKVDKWAQLITERPLETSGLVVVFVLVPHPDVTRKRQTPESVAGVTKKKIAKVLRGYPSRTPDAPANRIGVASWADWFPSAHTFREKFLLGSTDFPGADPGEWTTQDLFLDYAFTPWSGFDATAVLTNVNALGQTPRWQRPRPSGEIIGLPSERAGSPRPIPTVGADRAMGRPTSSAVGPTRPPVRLVDPLGVTGAVR